MKIVNKSIPVLLLMIAVLLIGSGCPSSNDPGPSACDFEGVTITDSNSVNTMIQESDLNTQYFPNASNGPFGNPGVEITENIDFSMSFTTNVITIGTSGAGQLTLNDTQYNVLVNCELEGNSVNEELRYSFTSSDVNGEFCVVIDEVLN